MALWAALVYWLVVFLRPSLALWRVALVASLLSFAVELLQLTPVSSWLSSQHVVLRLVFGTTFNGWDLPAYVGGVVLAWRADARWLSDRRTPGSEDTFRSGVLL